MSPPNAVVQVYHGTLANVASATAKPDGAVTAAETIILGNLVANGAMIC